MQFVRAESNVDLASIMNESELLGNIQSLMLSIALSFNVQAAYLFSELGYGIAVDQNSDAKPEFLDSRGHPWYVLAKENNAGA